VGATPENHDLQLPACTPAVDRCCPVMGWS
jgi:hypothetical protein